MSRPVVVLVTTSSPAESRKVARALLEGKLAACVNVVPGVASHYWWKGRIEKGKEQLLVIKTAPAKVNKLIRSVKSIHSYEVPEVVVLPVLAGNPAYLRWISDSVA